MEDKSIGGYFGLELRKGQHYHENAIRLNSARNCLAVILQIRRWKKVYLPYYTCGVMLQPIISQGINYGFYHIDSFLNPIELPTLQKDEAILFTNYFGLKQDIAEEMAAMYSEQLIIDNAQSFFSPRIPGIDTFYSPRKFIGVPDGGYLYTDIPFPFSYDRDQTSWTRVLHLCRRIDEGPEKGYDAFRQAEESLDYAPIKRMSRLTESILSGIDYFSIMEIRRKNFSFYHTFLSNFNSLEYNLTGKEVPLCYPFLSSNELRKRLLKAAVYIPYYWTNVKGWCSGEVERNLSENLLALPLDQRYDETDLERVVSIICTAKTSSSTSSAGDFLAEASSAY